MKRDDLSVFIPHVIESVFFEIQINERKTIIVGVVYRPNTQPRADIDIFMQKIIEIQSKIKEENKVAYLMGDFNIDLLKVNIHAKTNEFVNDVISQGFLPKITRPTRITPHSATLIDHIYSNYNRPTSQNSTSGIIITDVADHFGTFHIVNKWKSVLSGVPQGSVLGPILFLVYINDLEEGVRGNILKFADDTKLFTKTKEIGDKQNLQDDIDKLVKWSEKWQMLFNFGKCKCLHIGPGNTSMNYEMGGTILSTTVKEKDLGVTMDANMKVSEQCRIAASKANQVLGMIRRNITYKDKSLIVPLYKAIVRPHLEYCIQA